jgi:5'-methylthioadenosine phosphorylase
MEFATSSSVISRRNDMKIFGLIAGTAFQEEKSFDTMEKRILENDFGKVQALFSEGFVYIPRHGRRPKRHIPPHMINHRANLKALKDLGIKEIIGVNSTGSLKKELKPGTIIVPDDYISITGTPTIFNDELLHMTPVLSEKIRQRLITAADKCKIAVVKTGAYWQTTGPRLETKAEIRMMSNFADIVGMTMASEAVIAQELGLPYAAICSVDNYGHGIIDKPLNMKEIAAAARNNAKNILKIIDCYMETEKK